jgi:hypothetical protein
VLNLTANIQATTTEGILAALTEMAQEIKDGMVSTLVKVDAFHLDMDMFEKN